MTALTDRRAVLSLAGAVVALGATAASGTTLLVPPITATRPTAFAIGHARYRAAEARLNNSTALTTREEQDEEEAYITEWRAFKALRPSSLQEFAQAFLVLTDDGKSDMSDDVMGLMTADAKRLIGVV